MSSIKESKNFAKVIRFGNDDQKAYIQNAENAIQARIKKLAEEEASRKKAEEEERQRTIEADESEDPFDGEYIDIYCPHCGEKLSYMKWQINEESLKCPMCVKEFKYDEELLR